MIYLNELKFYKYHNNITIQKNKHQHLKGIMLAHDLYNLNQVMVFLIDKNKANDLEF